ncbi:MAG: bifunctional 3'-5' exonuclease/DNA polymerase [Bacillota bacterium]|nr:bifunctional 3'-5' exonuclease/DNA polymerase [Bacillota bacterium]
MNTLKENYIYADNDYKLKQHISFIEEASILGIDTETTGLDPFNDEIRLLQIASQDNPTLVIDMNMLNGDSLDRLNGIFEKGSIKVFQNAKFDLKFLLNKGFNITGPVFDTMLAAQMAADEKGPQSFNLEALADYYLDMKLPKQEQKSNWGSALRQEQLEYAARDAAVLLPLRERLIEDIKRGRLIEACKLEFDCLWAVIDMELSGIELDMEKWKRLQDSFISEQKELSLKLNKALGYGTIQVNLFGEEIHDGINLDSQSQVIKALKSRGIALGSTSHSELMEHREESELISWLMEYRRVTKAIQGFLSPIPMFINKATGRLHSSYRQIGSSSGRFSCSSPNIQQIPRGKEFRECFVPKEGNKLVIADYSQIELRVAAEIAQDETMIEAYRKGQDLHALTASLIANKKLAEITKAERQAAKAVNFGLIYAMGAKGLQGYAKTVYGIDMSLEDAELFRGRFFKAYRGIAEWHAAVKRSKNVKESRTLSGRRCVYIQEPGITALLNIPVQGTAADIAKKALGMLVPVVKKLRGSIGATVHDEILLEVPEDAAQEAASELKRIMEAAGAFYLKKVPVIAETVIADSWAEK